MDELELLAARLNQLVVDPHAKVGYELFAGGLLWSDESPAWNEMPTLEAGPAYPGLGHFRALLRHRHFLILGEENQRFSEVWKRAKQLCPNWPGFIPVRQSSSLAAEARAREAASSTAFEELETRKRKQVSSPIA